MSRFFSFLFIALFSLAVYAGPVDERTALIVANNFLNFQASKMGVMNLKTYNANVQLRSINNVNYYYVINYQNGGFVVVSADDNAIPVLAYSFEDKLDLNDMAPATQYWLGEFEQQFDILYSLNERSIESVKYIWEDFLQNNLSVERGSKGVNKLLTTKWNQGSPYNMYCPPHPKGPGGKCYAGCVATAIAQVMKYYNYPETGRYTKTYFWGDYFTVDFGATTYRWEEMSNTATSLSKEAIAELMFHCGVAVNMNYGYDGSGTQLEYAVEALKQYFRYRADNYFLNKDMMNDEDWKFLLRFELDMSRPILYRGTNDGGDGHAFVCDGYQDTSYFHFNWGWGGAGDGFFHLGDVNPVIDFKWGQGAIFNLNPHDAKYCDTIVFEQPKWTVTDGSGPNYYWNNSECSWLIAPQDAEKIFIQFLEFNTEPNKDILYVFDGADETAPLIGSYSGFSIPEDIQSTGSKIYCKFVTNETNQYNGWKFKYTTSITDIASSLNENIIIYPNPANEIAIIQHGENCKKIEMFNLLGTKVSSFECNSDKTNIDVSNLPKGIYAIRLIYNNEIIIKNLIVQ